MHTEYQIKTLIMNGPTKVVYIVKEDQLKLHTNWGGPKNIYKIEEDQQMLYTKFALYDDIPEKYNQNI